MQAVSDACQLCDTGVITRQRDAYWKRPGVDSAALSTLLRSLRNDLERTHSLSAVLTYLTHVRRPRQRTQLSPVRLSVVYIL